MIEMQSQVRKLLIFPKKCSYSYEIVSYVLTCKIIFNLNHLNEYIFLMDNLKLSSNQILQPFSVSNTVHCTLEELFFFLEY